jgi:hypothetical protein
LASGNSVCAVSRPEGDAMARHTSGRHCCWYWRGTHPGRIIMLGPPGGDLMPEGRCRGDRSCDPLPSATHTKSSADEVLGACGQHDPCPPVAARKRPQNVHHPGPPCAGLRGCAHRASSCWSCRVTVQAVRVCLRRWGQQQTDAFQQENVARERLRLPGLLLCCGALLWH